jgi:tetratricopeptide (TPR) repeat protein
MISEEDVHRLVLPFFGYLELGMEDDAIDVLERLPNELKQHPVVLSCRLELLMTKKRWEDGALLAQSLAGLWPMHFDFWFRAAFCLHELKRTVEARQTLLDAPELIREEPLFSYNMACYESQLGNVSRAKELLARTIEKAPQMKAEALDDPDLAAVWSSFNEPFPAEH